MSLIPWIAAGSGGFVLSRVAWSDDHALSHVRQSETRSVYVVITHLNTQFDRWTAALRLLRVTDGESIGKLEIAFAPSAPADGVIELARGLITLIEKAGNVHRRSAPTLYQSPEGSDLSNYLLRLEQLLAVRCAGMEGVSPNFLNGEREIIAGSLQLSLRCPNNIAIRILLGQTLLSMNRVKPDVVSEFSDKVMMLHSENPLTEPAQSVVQAMLSGLEV